MDLSFSKKGLQIFDASTLLLESSDDAYPGKNGKIRRERCMPVRALDLSNNSITRFEGGQALWSLTILDLSNNALDSLDAASLPSGLARLSVAHNALQKLRGLSSAVPKLQELDISFNRITTSGLSNLPRSLTSVLCQSNLIDSVEPFLILTHLHNLDVGSNQIHTIEELRRLRGMRALRHLELRGNPVMNEAGAVANVLEAVPRLIRLDRMPLSQAGENQMYKVYRSRSSKGSGTNGLLKNSNRSASLSKQSEPRSHRGGSEAELEIELLGTRVKELERLLSESKRVEHQLRDKRRILEEQVTACAGVINSQTMELERLAGEVKNLREEEAALREPVADLELTFEQTHASLVAHRLNHSIER